MENNIGADLFSPVRLFENRIATFTGFKYAVAVESCSAALFLSFYYRSQAGYADTWQLLPSRTYPSVPMQLIHAGFRPAFQDIEWQSTGFYPIGNLNVYDSAICINQGMRRHFNADSLVCLSFHAKKMLPIGRGGMILTDDIESVSWLKLARHDGRHDGVSLEDDVINMVGWNMLMTPEQASRGLSMIGNLSSINICPFQIYPDLRKFNIWNE